MKKILLTTIVAGCSVAAFGQGGILLANANNSSAHWNLTTASGTGAPVGTDVALFWNSGTTSSPNYIQVGATYTTTAANGDAIGAVTGGQGLYFYGTGNPIIIPTFSATGSFFIEGWTGGYASYATALAQGAYVGETATFTAAEANEGITPKGTPGYVDEGTGQNIAGEWNGNLVLQQVPEPSTIALGGLGAAALLLFRRKK